MLGGSGWLQSSSLITFQRVACHEFINSLIRCGQIARVIFCPQTLVFWTSSLSETYPRRALNKRDFFQFLGVAMTSSCFLSADQKFNGKKVLIQRLGLQGMQKSSDLQKPRYKKT